MVPLHSVNAAACQVAAGGVPSLPRREAVRRCHEEARTIDLERALDKELAPLGARPS
jgi:hypothetical protein